MCSDPQLPPQQGVLSLFNCGKKCNSLIFPIFVLIEHVIYFYCITYCTSQRGIRGDIHGMCKCFQELKASENTSVRECHPHLYCMTSVINSFLYIGFSPNSTLSCLLNVFLFTSNVWQHSYVICPQNTNSVPESRMCLSKILATENKYQVHTLSRFSSLQPLKRKSHCSEASMPYLYTFNCPGLCTDT